MINGCFDHFKAREKHRFLNKAGPFMGSEFAYENISSQEVEKYTYNYLRDEKVNGFDCFLVEYDPVDRKSGYSRQLV